MNKSEFFEVLLMYIKDNSKYIYHFSLYIIVNIVVFLLYSIMLEPILYSLLLIVIFAFLYFIVDFTKYFNLYNKLNILNKHIDISIKDLPKHRNRIEDKYHNLITTLYNELHRISKYNNKKKTEMIDYYTLWAHQIKTPIQAMRLLLQSNNGDNNELLIQLTKIEQYVQMVLGYLRVDSSSSDLQLQKCDLSNVVKQAIKRNAKLFIHKSINLNFNESKCIVLSDEKWLLFVIEQVLLNSLKYTNEGSISITIDQKEHLLIIEDTGIGISKEDLPRVFEKGFTGFNGRIETRSTGIGLYLCKKILDKLSHEISISSRSGIGTKVTINLSNS